MDVERSVYRFWQAERKVGRGKDWEIILIGIWRRWVVKSQIVGIFWFFHCQLVSSFGTSCFSNEVKDEE